MVFRCQTCDEKFFCVFQRAVTLRITEDRTGFFYYYHTNMNSRYSIDFILKYYLLADAVGPVAGGMVWVFGCS